MKVSALEGPYLSYWLARAMGTHYSRLAVIDRQVCVTSDSPIMENRPRGTVRYHEAWDLSGPLFELYDVSLLKIGEKGGPWTAIIDMRLDANGAPVGDIECVGPDMLTAGLRCIITAELGAEVPDLVRVLDRGTELAPELQQ